MTKADKIILCIVGALLLFLGGVVCYAFKIGWPPPCPEIITAPIVHPVVIVPLDSGNVHITPVIVKPKPKDAAIKRDSSIICIPLDSASIKHDSDGNCINFGQKFPSGDSVAAMLCSDKIPLKMPDINGYLMLYGAPDTLKTVIIPPIRVNKRLGIGPAVGFGWSKSGGWDIHAGVDISWHAIEF